MSWSKDVVEWIDGDTAYLSVVFSWHLQRAYQRAAWLRMQGYHVRAGGPAVSLNPTFLADVAEIGGDVPALKRHNPDACFTTRGCIRQCQFCAVPKIEGAFRELHDFDIAPIVCDNNFLASSRRHFDRVIDALKDCSGVDFNQGLDARLLTDYHAGRLAELDLHCARLAWDFTGMEPELMAAYETLRRAGLPKRLIRVYVLIGFNDTPEDALYRLETVRGLGLKPNPMRYQPLDAKKRNEYVAPSWTGAELRRYMHYWSRLAWYNGIPFTGFVRR